MKKLVTGFVVLALVLLAPSAVFADGFEGEGGGQQESQPQSSGSTGGGVGGAFVYCSGPMAPGWNVSLPGGGCGGSNGASGNGGSVAGATTTCTPYLTDYMHKDWNNNPDEVKKLQTFLNKELGLSLSVNGTFDVATFEAVVKFQEKYVDEILKPWGVTSGTGFVYKTTIAKINSLQCGN